MIRNLAIFAKCLFVLASLINADRLLAQAVPDRKTQNASSQDKKRLERFEKQVDDLRDRLKIPGMSAVIVKDQKVLWAKGFGFADLENRIPANPDTVFHLASITKTFASTLIMQLVEQGKLDLDEPMSRYSTDFKDDSVKIKHIISHTSNGTPGERYQYDGNRFDYLTAVIEKKFGRPFFEVIVETFLEPLGMSGSVPFNDIVDEADKRGASLGKEKLDRYRKNLARFSQAYTFYGDRDITHVWNPSADSLGASAGLLSTVLDMAKYDTAIDAQVFLKKETQQTAWTAFTSNSGQRLPYGLGWFITDHQGQKLIWHYGHWGIGFSSIYLKVPEKNVSLVMLANSEALADHQFQVGDDITSNVFACNFLRLFDVQGDCEQNSDTALAKWIEHRRKNAIKSVRLDSKTLEAYVGQYQYEDPPNRIFTVSREGDRLFTDMYSRNHKLELFAESESKFFFKIPTPRHAVFIRGDAQVTHLELVAPSWKMRAKRVK